MCHCLDLQLAAMTNPSITGYSSTFQDYHCLQSEVTGLTSQIQHEIERKTYLEQVIMRLLLTSAMDDEAVSNTDIQELLTTIKQKISSLVSACTMYVSVKPV